MKLAEALSRRKDLEKRISEIKKLLENTIRVQEGDEPAEDPNDLMKELDGCLQQLEYYIYVINVTNMAVKDENGVTMTQLLAKRDVLAKRIAVLRNTYDQASGPAGRFSRSEIKFVNVIDIKPLRLQINQLAQQYRELDMKIQTLNFTNDLLEQ
ncbi:MAG: DIP1984 family protein [Prevotella sp.]|nr:DIP1984 family protein [Prevotella sp.]